MFKIPQVDGVVDSDARYELKIETHDTCTEEDVIEALEANFYGTLEYNHKDQNPYLNYMLIQNLGTESPSKEEKHNISTFQIAVGENYEATRIIESWNERYNIDKLAFKNYDFKTRSIMIEKATRL